MYCMYMKVICILFLDAVQPGTALQYVQQLILMIYADILKCIFQFIPEMIFNENEETILFRELYRTDLKCLPELSQIQKVNLQKKTRELEKKTQIIEWKSCSSPPFCLTYGWAQAWIPLAQVHFQYGSRKISGKSIVKTKREFYKYHRKKRCAIKICSIINNTIF